MITDFHYRHFHPIKGKQMYTYLIFRYQFQRCNKYKNSRAHLHMDYGGATYPLGAVGHLSRDVKLPTFRLILSGRSRGFPT